MSKDLLSIQNSLDEQQPSTPVCKPGKSTRTTWKSCLKKARPFLTTRRRGHEAEPSDCVVQLLVTQPNYMRYLCQQFPFVCKIGELTGCGPALLHEVCKERGWKEYQTSGTDPTGNGWNLWWQYGKTPRTHGRCLSPWQMTNWADQKYNFTDKDVCSRFLTRLRNTYGPVFDFGPMSFNLPHDYPRLCSEHSKRTKKGHACSARSSSAGTQRRIHRQRSSEEPIWICKPVGKSRGRGITVFDTPTKFGYHTQSVVQEYISRPYLIGGYKWDLRIYVAIVSTNPLIIYAYREGIVRFATDPFTLKNLYNPYAHLTNTSVNKTSPSYKHPKQVVGIGCKWTLEKLRRYWNDNNVKDWYLWQRIWKILILTIIGDADNIATMLNSSKTFSLFGFDIMVDGNMKPYLLEVNKTPALGHDCEVDTIVKKPMLHDLFDLLGLPNIKHFDSNLEPENICPDENLAKTLRLVSGRIKIGTEAPAMQYCNESNHRRTEFGISWCKAPLYISATTDVNGNDRYEKQHDADKSYLTSVKNPYCSLNGSPGNQRLDPPLSVKIPSRNKAEKGNLINTEEKAGIFLGIRNWKESAPPSVGDWSRIFPFDTVTDEIARKGPDFEIRQVLNRVNDYMRCAKLIAKNCPVRKDLECDSSFQLAQNLNVSVWHPYNISKNNSNLSPLRINDSKK